MLKTYLHPIIHSLWFLGHRGWPGKEMGFWEAKATARSPDLRPGGWGPEAKQLQKLKVAQTWLRAKVPAMRSEGWCLLWEPEVFEVGMGVRTGRMGDGP